MVSFPVLRWVAVLWLLAGSVQALPLYSPEQQLQASVDLLRQGNSQEALQQLSRLTQRQPNFRAAQLLYAQVLAARSGQPSAVLQGENPQVKELLQESRLRSLPETVYAGLLPSQLLKLSDHHRYLIAVDLSKARLYVLEQNAGQVRVVKDVYAAMGRSGWGKNSSGDLRTPVGIYETSAFLSDDGLPELYGLGAFPLNYPNSWDQLRNRTGSGIWLHGVPRHTFSRTPRSSEGCVTLANNDIETLRRFIVPHQTPVLLASQIRWQPALKSVGERQLLSALVEQWQRQWAARNLTGFLDFYRDHALIEGQPKGIWSQQLARSLQNPAPLSIKVSELDLWVYPDEKNLVMAQFKQHYQNGNIQTVTRRQQYWQFAGGNWKIVREQTL